MKLMSANMKNIVFVPFSIECRSEWINKLPDSVLFMFSTATHLQLSWGIVNMFVFSVHFFPKSDLFHKKKYCMRSQTGAWDR